MAPIFCFINSTSRVSPKIRNISPTVIKISNPETIDSNIPLELISPNEINKGFYKSLDKVLSYGNVNFFQLRLKKIKTDRIYQISKKIKKITLKHKVNFIINDNYN